MVSHKVFSIDEIKNRLNKLFIENNIKKAVLFGSYAKGCASEKSDIDLLVYSDLNGMDFLCLSDDIRSLLDGKDVDVFDVTHIIPFSDIDMEIFKTGTKIYESK